jgi:hypothetical protein
MKLLRDIASSAIHRSPLPHVQHSEDAAGGESHRSHASHGYADHKPYGSVILIWTVRLEKIRIMLAYAKLAHDN